MWRIAHDGLDVFVDTDEHAALVARTLRLDEPTWRGVLERYTAQWRPGLGPAARLAALRTAFTEVVPMPAPPPLPAPPICPACGRGAVVAAFARGSPGTGKAGPPGPAFSYGRCPECGHGVLLSGRADDSVYASADYYRRQSPEGVGYRDYERERAYRETKGRRLLTWALARLPEPPRTFLEVGSGFGYTRRAAEELGLDTLGVDLNPCAAAAATRLYGMRTVTNTLAGALHEGTVEPARRDLLLYNFVLEHVADPAAELRDAAAALRPNGALLLVVPSMEAREIDVFGACYRSFRSDHLHLFSRRSLGLLLAGAGFECDVYETSCSAHLLRGVLSEEELRVLYERGGGPDVTLLAHPRA